MVLIPGFFAFDALGDIRYFAGVEESLYLLDAATGDPKGIRTASVVTQAPKPALGAFRAQGPDWSVRR